MCRHEENICYIRINHEHNRKLVDRNLLLRDNGTVNIGNFMRILGPHLIIQEMQQNILVWLDPTALIIKTSTVFPNYIINSFVEGNKSGVVILNNTTLGIHRTQEIQTRCTGKYYDLSKTTWNFESRMWMLR